MRVIQRGPASLGDGELRDFACSLQTTDLALATRRGYGVSQKVGGQALRRSLEEWLRHNRVNP